MLSYSIPIGAFDKPDNKICRNIDCNNRVKPPLRKYCSDKCAYEFNHWYIHTFVWVYVRDDVFERDGYKCVQCGKEAKQGKELRYGEPNGLEADHIRPQALASLYRDYWDNKVYRTINPKYKKWNIPLIMGYIYNKKNLRTLCGTCHKLETGDFLVRYARAYRYFRIMFGEPMEKPGLLETRPPTKLFLKDPAQITIDVFV